MQSNPDQPLTEEALQIEVDGQKGFAVLPKSDCPHCLDSMVDHLDSSFSSLKELLLTSPCRECGDNTENWLCLTCENLFCSRYVNKHMSVHYEEMKHPVAFSLSDGSFWCYECSSYIINNQLSYMQSKFSNIKFPEN